MGTPEQDLHRHLADEAKAERLDAASESWVANRALELRSERVGLCAALEWHACEKGNESLDAELAGWFVWQQIPSASFGKQHLQAATQLENAMIAICEAYAEEVLLPEYLAKVQNGDFCG